MTTKIKQTALRSIDTERYTATNIEVWPNGLGVNFRFRGVCFEVLCDRDLRRIEAVRRNANDEPTHIYKLHDYQVAPSTVEGLIELCCLLWMDRRDDWDSVK